MGLWQDIDIARSASHREMILHLCGPFVSGAVDTAVPIDVTGRVMIPWVSREPLLLLAPSFPLDGQTLRVQATLDPDGAKTALAAVEFAPYTEQGAFLPLYLPGVDPNTRTANSFVVGLSLSKVASDGTEIPQAAATITDQISATLLEGTLGRLLYIIAAEKQRIRRIGRELASMRFLSTGRDDALNRYGAELAVPRFADQIQFEPAIRQIVTVMRTNGAGAIVAEPDAEYRRRLALYRTRIMPNRKQLAAWLNGPGKDSDDNQSFLGAMGFKRRFQIVEKTNPFAIAIQLVGTGDAKYRTNFLSFIRSVFLVWPAASAAANATHMDRYTPSITRQQTEAIRTSLRQSFKFADDGAIAPMLAVALERVARCRRLLGDNSVWDVTRAQDAAGGSRYELGLGIDVPPLATAVLDAMGATLTAAHRPAVADAEVEALLRTMTFLPSGQDPEGKWLLSACGLQTVHRVNAGTIYLSHLPTFGMTVAGTNLVAIAGQTAGFDARFQAPGEPSGHVVLVTGLAAAAKSWAGAGGAAWTTLADADAQAQWDKAQDPQPLNALNIFRVAGLPANQRLAPIVTQLKLFAPELLTTIKLNPAQTQEILAGQVAAGDDLLRLVNNLRQQNLNSVLPIVTGPAAGPNDILLVVGVVSLPGAGLNLSERRSTGYRWYVVPLDGAGGKISIVGSRAAFVPSGAGLSAIVALGYARFGLEDPYEYRVDLPDDAMLDLGEYEFLMNLLERTYPAGMMVNTYAIRHGHVDLDGDGKADTLPPGVSRSYRKFRHLRQRGEFSIPLD